MAEVSEQAPEVKPTQEPEEESELVKEEEITEISGWQPSVSLDLQQVASGEEAEEAIYSQRSKLYRWDNSADEGMWKERGTGDCKLLKHKENSKIRLLMRQEKTGKIVANHYVIEQENFCVLKPNAGSDKCWVWMAGDFAEGELVTEQFALKFRDAELASAFKTAFDDAKAQNEALRAQVEGAAAEKKEEEEQQK